MYPLILYRLFSVARIYSCKTCLLLLPAILVSAPLGVSDGEQAPAFTRERGGDDFLKPSLQQGQVLTDVFSRTVSIEGAGMDRSVHRDSAPDPTL